MTHRYSDAETTALLDRFAIREVLERYFHGMGTGDFDEICSTFTEDAKFASGVGHAAIRETLAPIVNFQSLVMMSANPKISVEGDIASADTQGVAIRVVKTENGHTVQVLGLHYFDTFYRTEAGWLIVERHGRVEPTKAHDTPWQFDAVATKVFPN